MCITLVLYLGGHGYMNTSRCVVTHLAGVLSYQYYLQMRVRGAVKLDPGRIREDVEDSAQPSSVGVNLQAQAQGKENPLLAALILLSGGKGLFVFPAVELEN